MAAGLSLLTLTFLNAIGGAWAQAPGRDGSRKESSEQ